MKVIRTLFNSALFIGIFTISSFAEIDTLYSNSDISKIENYLSTHNDGNATSLATIYVNFLVSEEGDLYNVDFMITENNEIIILSKVYEDEYYKVDSYSTEHMEKYAVPVSSIKNK